MDNDDYKHRVITMCDERDEIDRLDDGYQYYFPSGHGALSSVDLRIIADELDRRNKDWEEQVERDLSSNREREDNPCR